MYVGHRKTGLKYLFPFLFSYVTASGPEHRAVRACITNRVMQLCGCALTNFHQVTNVTVTEVFVI